MDRSKRMDTCDAEAATNRRDTDAVVEWLRVVMKIRDGDGSRCGGTAARRDEDAGWRRFGTQLFLEVSRRFGMETFTGGWRWRRRLR